ncbi:uncharacterized protein LOC106522629 isoform X3 [Austrofundulus limnaeus]|uniref:Uncharacterized protein LOC106522629 isoform X3 n=1 Tax=Austrofundulus limnaeus TaxID=52670 RepID=A0A2I4BTT0_AUSLI|nr:PREDICTED: uncharacterized protein LOC106522629 isoform X3 [Austrofundulus limnaeus]
MGCLCQLGWLFLLIVASNIEAQKKYSLNVSTKCLGNIMRVDVGPLGGNLLEVAVVINNTAVVLTPSLATQCGFSMKTDKLGNALIYVSLQNCFAQNVDDKMFSTALQLRTHGNLHEDELYQVAESCYYDAWASREIICDYNYMEVSVKRATPEEYAIPQTGPRSISPRQAAEKPPLDSSFSLTNIVFFTPAGEKTMSVTTAQKNGYGIGNTPTRLVLRSPMGAPEMFTQDVGGVPMRVLKTSTIFEKQWLATQIDVAAACPTQEGSVFITQTTITWYLPRRPDPIATSGQFNLLMVQFGINGQRLNAAEMQAQQYSVVVNDYFIVTEIPIGAAGGYYKSHVKDNQYSVSYMIEPMLELLWTEEATQVDTRYKVFFHIATHLMPQPLQLIDNTVPAEQMFKLMLGQFATDVVLINITFPSEVLSMADCSARGFNIMEHMSPSSSMKIFTLQVPFTDPVVIQQTKGGMLAYALHLTFGFMVLEDLVPFAYTAYVEAAVQSMAVPVPPSITGGCDNQNFYVLVKYGTPGYRFQTAVGKRFVTPNLAQQYGYMENKTHFSFVVPFTAPDVAVEAIEESSIRCRLDLVLSNPENKAKIQDFSMACNFPTTLTDCFPNGTMTALAVKLESVPSLDPAQLTLADPTCGPSYSDDRYAYFAFTVNSCGTTRKFLPSGMLYENDISLPDAVVMRKGLKSEEPEYHLKVSCLYDINTSQAVAFSTRARRSEPYAEDAKGQLQVVIKLASDDSYKTFQNLEEYPIAKYLQQPLYFEVELMGSANPQVSLQLENCWATQNENRTSQPRWNLIINGCPNPVDPYQVVFHEVWTDSRVKFPSHVKRFEVQMFAFGDEDDMNSQVFVHCDAMICDTKNPLGGICTGQCPNPDDGTKDKRRDQTTFENVSIGPVTFSQLK